MDERAGDNRKSWLPPPGLKPPSRGSFAEIYVPLGEGAGLAEAQAAADSLVSLGQLELAACVYLAEEELLLALVEGDPGPVAAVLTSAGIVPTRIAPCHWLTNARRAQRRRPCTP